MQDCWSLKHKIQNMIESSDIMVKQLEQPNVTTNHLPQHNGMGVNVIESGDSGNYLKYLRIIDDSYEVIAMISNLRKAKGELIMIRGFIGETRSVNPIKMTKPQLIILPAVPQ